MDDETPDGSDPIGVLPYTRPSDRREAAHRRSPARRRRTSAPLWVRRAAVAGCRNQGWGKNRHDRCLSACKHRRNRLENASDAGGTPFASRQAPVAQLDRASDYESEGQEFESLRARHLPSSSVILPSFVPSPPTISDRRIDGSCRTARKSNRRLFAVARSRDEDLAGRHAATLARRRRRGTLPLHEIRIARVFAPDRVEVCVRF